MSVGIAAALQSLSHSYYQLFNSHQDLRRQMREERFVVKTQRNEIAALHAKLSAKAADSSAYPQESAESIWSEIFGKLELANAKLDLIKTMRQQSTAVARQMSLTLAQIRAQNPNPGGLPSLPASISLPVVTCAGLKINGDLTYTGTLIRW